MLTLPIYLDRDGDNADWLRRRWRWPAYKSKEFMEALTQQGMTLEEFRRLSVYRVAVEEGWIKDDEWIGQPTENEGSG